MAAEAFGVLGRFDSPSALVAAARELRENGYVRMDGFTPIPVKGLAEALGHDRPGIAFPMLVGGVLGGLGAYGLQVFATAVDYPLNVGGRPLHSWPAFVPVAFELTILGAALFGLAAMLWRIGLPRLHHPVFEIEAFERASIDGFFLCVEAKDGAFGPETRRLLEDLGAREIWEVPAT